MTKSKCCSAPIRTAHGCDSDLGHNPCDCLKSGGVTCWNECEKCDQPCDIEECGPKMLDKIDQDWWEEELEGILDSVEFLHGVPVKAPMQTIANLKSFIRQVEKKAYRDGLKDAIKEMEKVLNQ